jgi:EAL and modified HD-GYP domain-containing signal transduction protein
MPDSSNVFMARQPIYDRKVELFAYELLFRRSEDQTSIDIQQGEDADALINTLVDIGLNQLAGETRAFINVSQDLLMSPSILTLPKDRVVIELLETIIPDPEVVDRVKQLRALGYTIALDDFVFSAEITPLIDLAHIIKLEVMDVSELEISRKMQKVKRPGMVLLAEKVETREQFGICEGLGFDLFQGYFFAKPELLKASRIPANRLSLMRLAAKLQAPDLQYADLEEIIASDVALSYRLLKFVKSAHLGLPGTVQSVKQALLFLGVNTVSSLTTLLAMTSNSSKPGELVTTALVRAKMCELLAIVQKAEKPDRYFTVGLLSVLDALLDSPMQALLVELPLAEEINEALLNADATSRVAQTLQATLAFERGEWDTSPLVNVSPRQICDAYNMAVSWASHSGAAMAAA